MGLMFKKLVKEKRHEFVGKLFDRDTFKLPEDSLIEWFSNTLKEAYETVPKCKHDFQSLSTEYYKESSEDGAFHKTYDQSVAYTTLYCPKCGATKEVISQNHRGK